MQVSIELNLDLDIETEKTLTLGTLAQAIREQNIEAKLVEKIVQSVDKQRTRKYCGEKYRRGNGEKRYQRGGTTTRTATTTAGTHRFTLHQVKDTEEGRYFRPLEDLITFDGKNHYQEDVSMYGVDLATKLSYRDATREGELFSKMPSPSTINRRVKEYGAKLKSFIEERITGRESDCIQADGTKCKSQEDTVSQHDIHVTLDSNDNALLDIRVNEPWNETAKNLDKNNAVTDNTTVVSDAEPAFRKALVTKNRRQQLDLVHLVRTTGYKLWEDDELKLEERRRVRRSLEQTLYPLTTAVKTARQLGDESYLHSWIDRTVKTLRQIATNLYSLGCPKTANYIQRCSNHAVTFARLALENVQVPWTSNRIERLMGEISKRCKHQWMTWTTEGLDSLLRLILTRTTNPEQFNQFKQEVTHQTNQNYITTEVSMNHAREKF